MLVKGQVTILSDHIAHQEIDYDVGFTDIDKHIVLEIDGLFLPYKDTITNTQIFDKVRHTVQIKLDLEMTTPMLFSCLLILVWNNEVIHHMFNCSAFIVKTLLVLLDTFLAAEVNKAIFNVSFTITFQ